MNAHDEDQLVADYLRQLSTAASALPADRAARPPAEPVAGASALQTV